MGGDVEYFWYCCLCRCGPHQSPLYVGCIECKHNRCGNCHVEEENLLKGGYISPPSTLPAPGLTNTPGNERSGVKSPSETLDTRDNLKQPRTSENEDVPTFPKADNERSQDDSESLTPRRGKHPDSMNLHVGDYIARKARDAIWRNMEQRRRRKEAQSQSMRPREERERMSGVSNDWSISSTSQYKPRALWHNGATQQSTVTSNTDHFDSEYYLRDHEYQPEPAQPDFSQLVKTLANSILTDWKLENVSMNQLCENLPNLLQDFAQYIGYLEEFPQSKELMQSIQESRVLIVAKLRSILEAATAIIKTTGDEPYRILAGQNPRTENSDAPEKMSAERMATKEVHNNREASFPHNQGNLLSSAAYPWLLSRVRRHITLSHPSPNSMQLVHDTIVNSLIRHSKEKELSRKSTIQIFRVDISVDWDLLGFIREQEYSEDPEVTLRKIVTVTGSPSHAQALTVEEYIQQTWPVTGIEILQALEDAIRDHREGNRRETEYKLCTGTTIRSVIENGMVIFQSNGTLNAVGEVSEQVAWMGAAIRSIPNNNRLSCCSPRVRSIDLRNKSSAFDEIHVACRIDFAVEGLQDGIESAGQCWNALFRNGMVVSGFPIRARSMEDTGMEVPLGILAGLLKSRQIQDFGDHIFIKVFNALLVVTKSTEDIVIWHLLYNQDGKHMSYTDRKVIAAIGTAPPKVNIHSLQSARHVVGWCPKVACIAGAPGASDQINQSELPNTHQGCVLEKVVISGGQFITASASFVLGKKDNPVFLRPRDDYFEQVSWISRKLVILHDIEDRRAWMVDGASALLHLVRASLKCNENDDFSHLFLFDPTQLVETASYYAGRKAAISVLTNEDNLNLKIRQRTVETTEEETIKADGTVEKVIKRKTTYYTFRDRVDHICHFLEQMMAHQSQALSQDGIGFNIKGMARRRLDGFDFMDIAEGRDPLMPRIATLASAGEGWVEFARSIRAITLFGRGFGDILKPTNDAQICANWKTVPVGLDYLAMAVSDIQEILRTRGCINSTPESNHSPVAKTNSNGRYLKLVDEIFWLNPDTLFGPCKSFNRQKGGQCCERVQILLSSSKPRLWTKYASPTTQDLSTAQRGAVIFGHDRKLSLLVSKKGNPK